MCIYSFCVNICLDGRELNIESANTLNIYWNLPIDLINYNYLFVINRNKIANEKVRSIKTWLKLYPKISFASSEMLN